MLKSLFSGVSGLQSHQIAMDVESNNIANVNTIGFKYSRANFSDLLAQTNQIATAPQGSLGGKNAVQVGLGATVASVTRIHSQGSIQNTDKNTDVAIQGDGFFIVSPDGGNTYKYTRSGDFKFDGNGNFVDNNGFISQGWLRDEDTGIVDATAPIQDIIIPPGLTTPANASTVLTIKANLNSGSLVDQFSPSLDLDSTLGLVGPEKEETFGALFDASGNSLGMIGPDSGTLGAGPIVGGQGISVNFGNPLVTKEFRYSTDPALAGTWVVDPTVAAPATGTLATSSVYYFQTTEDLRAALQEFAQDPGATGAATSIAEVSFELGKIVMKNPDDLDANDDSLLIQVDDVSITDPATLENIRFTSNMQTIQGTLAEGGTIAGNDAPTKRSQTFNAAVHSSSIDIFDSLGSKHTIKVDFRKISSSSWGYTLTSPNGTDIGGTAPNLNVIEGATFSEPGSDVTFGTNGQLTGISLPSFDFTGNNGSEADQTISLDFGTVNSFEGLTSFDNPSATSGISQDGFPGGDLLGIRIDQSGTLIGSFSNGRSFGLAQISMAKFANNEGLVADGGNVYTQSANSGDPIIGQAATAGRGFIQSAALEASNVDLSRSLTQLIIIQRGYQANGKTITTSDQLLNTLINLKN